MAKCKRSPEGIKAAPEECQRAHQLAGLSTLGVAVRRKVMRLIWKKDEKRMWNEKCHKPSFVSYLWDKENSQVNFLSQFLSLVTNYINVTEKHGNLVNLQ